MKIATKAMAVAWRRVRFNRPSPAGCDRWIASELAVLTGVGLQIFHHAGALLRPQAGHRQPTSASESMRQ
ncbi:hypothetical protein A5779_21390 [Mycolicibacterium peregrinum]|uniref:Uncharacterized protein n=1 Tax=Mycolicibacterium peregrinum TaxID=43304 RepID=A0A1A0W8Z5_MYCPR|nr:hypothetical protein A5779_21390 [Mycolicibacterium peregrinum]